MENKARIRHTNYMSAAVEKGRQSLYRPLSELSTAMYGPSTLES
jgi:hypothetical protein